MAVTGNTACIGSVAGSALGRALLATTGSFFVYAAAGWAGQSQTAATMIAALTDKAPARATHLRERFDVGSACHAGNTTGGTLSILSVAWLQKLSTVERRFRKLASVVIEWARR